MNEIRHNNMVVQKNYELAQIYEDMSFDMSRHLEDVNFKAHLYKLIKQLPPQKQEVCLLKIQKGMSNQEIAEAMNISVPTVKSHYTQLIKILRSQIDKIAIIILYFKHLM